MSTYTPPPLTRYGAYLVDRDALFQPLFIGYFDAKTQAAALKLARKVVRGTLDRCNPYKGGAGTISVSAQACGLAPEPSGH